MVLAAAGAAGLLLFGGSGESPPQYVPSGARVASVLTPATPKGIAAHPLRSSPFKPAPAALSVAAGLPLERQVSQLFLVSLDGSSATAAAGVGAEG